jgi:hypothetical protein
MADKKRIRARYATKYLGKQKVEYVKCTIDAETKSLQQEPAVEERDCWMVYFPQGHSIRVTSRAELERMGFDKKPRMVDMETGDVVDTGGDPYDFADNPHDILETHVEEMEDEDVTRNRPSRTKEKENV